jgi:glycogen debranching enzyme
MDNTPLKGSGWVDLSSQMVRQYRDLAFIAQETGQKSKADMFEARANEIAKKINELMWDEQSGMYWNLDDSNTWQKCRAIGFSWPLMAGVASQSQAERLKCHLMDTNTFYRMTPFATLAATEPQYDPKGGYWLGSSWAPTTYQAIKGLERYGFEQEAAAASEKYLTSMAAVFKKTGTVWENYAPDSNAPGNSSKPDFVGWTGCGPIALLIENVIGLRPDAAHDRVTWHLRRTDRHGIERLRLGGTTLSLVCKKRDSADSPATLTLSANSKFTVEILHPKGKMVVSLEPDKTVEIVVPGSDHGQNQ